ncbi:ribonuclease R, partial [Mycobacterium tuberculosis]
SGTTTGPTRGGRRVDQWGGRSSGEGNRPRGARGRGRTGGDGEEAGNERARRGERAGQRRGSGAGGARGEAGSAHRPQIAGPGQADQQGEARGGGQLG